MKIIGYNNLYSSILINNLLSNNNKYKNLHNTNGNSIINENNSLNKTSPLEDFLQKASFFYLTKAENSQNIPSKVTNLNKAYSYSFSFENISQKIDLKIPYEDILG
ncbi:MAG: hypothetical protein N3A58_07530 [Spirochaetes bacterium]|nr:hypothetical protein [Spirochaetota bacterium]